MSNRKGFTLIEILIVLAIIGILLSITYPSLARSYDSSKENERARQESVVNRALKQYYALTGTYPNQGHDRTKPDIPDIVITTGPLGELIYTPIGELLALKDGLKDKTGFNLDVKKYIYTYKDVNGDGNPPYEIRSIYVKSR